MRLAISAPSGYNTRELLSPLHDLLEADSDIAEVRCITPAASVRTDVFPGYSKKFTFVENPTTAAAHQEVVRGVDVVVTPTAGLDYRDAPILHAAKAAGVPTVTFVASWDNVYKMERMKRFNKDYVLADALAVWNTYMRDLLLQVFPEVSPEAVTLTGAPRFDIFAHRDKIPSRDDLLAYLQLPDTNAALIHCATTELYPFGYIMRTLAHHNLGRQVQLFVSVHPGGNLARHRAAAESVGAAIGFSFGRRDTAAHPAFQYNPTSSERYLQAALFLHSDLLVNQSSTVTIESLLADVPVINVRFGRRLDWIRWRRSMVYRDFNENFVPVISSGATAVVRTRAELVAAARAYLAHPAKDSAARRALIQQLITVTDGTAGAKLLALIKRTAGGGQ